MVDNHFQNWNNMLNAMMGPFAELQGSNNKYAQQYSREMMDFMSNVMTSMVKTSQKASTMREPQEFLQNQVDTMVNMSSHLFGSMQNICKINKDALEDFAKQMQVQMEQMIKTTSKKAA